MVKRIVILLVVIGLLYFGYRYWTSRQQTMKADSGDFSCQGCDSPEEHARFLKENSGETADGNSEHKTANARVAAEQAYNGDASSTASTAPAAPASPAIAPATGRSTMVAPADQAAQSTVYPPAPATSTLVVPPASQPSALSAGLPTHDSESPNAPNGMRFAGSGSYQWYRQGNITWRVDTTTGRSCIIYATIEEWRKQIVMSHGCGRSA